MPQQQWLTALEQPGTGTAVWCNQATAPCHVQARHGLEEQLQAPLPPLPLIPGPF